MEWAETKQLESLTLSTNSSQESEKKLLAVGPKIYHLLTLLVSVFRLVQEKRLTNGNDKTRIVGEKKKCFSSKK